MTLDNNGAVVWTADASTFGDKYVTWDKGTGDDVASWAMITVSRAGPAGPMQQRVSKKNACYAAVVTALTTPLARQLSRILLGQRGRQVVLARGAT